MALCNIVNVTKLAEAVVESWDMDTLVGYAQVQLAVDYGNNEELFQLDWASTIEGKKGRENA